MWFAIRMRQPAGQFGVRHENLCVDLTPCAERMIRFSSRSADPKQLSLERGWLAWAGRALALNLSDCLSQLARNEVMNATRPPAPPLPDFDRMKSMDEAFAAWQRWEALMDARMSPDDRWFCSVIDRAAADRTLIPDLRREVLNTPHAGRGVLLRHLDEIAGNIAR